MPSLRSLAAAGLFALVGLCRSVAPAAADDGDPAGWSAATDPRKRAFLVATDRAGGPRLLTFACLRDVDGFGVYANLPAGRAKAGDAVRLVLRAGAAEMAVDGTLDDDGAGGLGFTHDRDLDAAGRKALAAALLPILKAPGPLVVTLAAAASVEVPLAAVPPKVGIAAPLARFEKVCFGR